MLRVAFTLGLALLALAAPAHAETLRLRYEASVLGVVTLGEARYEIATTPTRFAVRANLQTSGLARLFDQTEISASSSGLVLGAGLAWTRYDLSHAYAGKFRRVQLNRVGTIVSAQIAPLYGDMGDPPASIAQQSSSYDPLTGLLALGRQIGVARGCAGSVLIFDGRGHYRLAVAPKGQGQFDSGGYVGPALNCELRYEPIAGFDMPDRANIPVTDAWFALPERSGFAAPLRLTAPTPLGDARLELRGYERMD
ncbi:hypothetical protein U91I_01547 [alpha proteobacterium U9-1i]|nr:hypothetical protein U91I_01547 [alpha proteobacterium U9-1i]